MIVIDDSFNRLDAAAKTKAGTPILRYDRQTGDPLGRSVDTPIPVYIRPFEDALQISQMACIAIARTIDLDVFRSSNGGSIELDRSQIPDHLVFDYVVHHEIGHARGGDSGILRHFTEVEKWSPGRVSALAECLELRADRYAWREICPGRALPARKGEMPERCTRSFDGFLLGHADQLEALRPTIVPLSTDPTMYIPLWNFDVMAEVQEPETRLCTPGRLDQLWKRLTRR